MNKSKELIKLVDSLDSSSAEEQASQLFQMLNKAPGSRQKSYVPELVKLALEWLDSKDFSNEDIELILKAYDEIRKGDNLPTSTQIYKSISN